MLIIFFRDTKAYCI